VTTQIKEKYGDKVRFVFRQFPLSFHKRAHKAAQASLAAHAQGKFWKYHDVLFANAKELEPANLETHAKTAGLELASFKAALDGDKFKEQVDADIALGSKVSVQGTPTLFVNGKRVANPTDFNAVSQMIDEELKSGS
jgi:protein-disulfide isomerase